MGASLKGGELLVHLRFNQTPEDYTVGGTRLDNGHLHLIEVVVASNARKGASRGRFRSSSNYRPLAQVVRNSTLVQVKLNGTEYFRKSISAAKQLDAQVGFVAPAVCTLRSLSAEASLTRALPPGAVPGRAPAAASPRQRHRDPRDPRDPRADVHAGARARRPRRR